MDFQAFWHSIERKREVRQVERDQCFCTHICFMYDSMRHSKRVMLWELPKLAIKLAMETILKHGAEKRNPMLEKESETSSPPPHKLVEASV